MRLIQILKWLVILAVVALAGAFLHYNLPSRDVVRIVGVDVKRVEVAGKDQTSTGTEGYERTKDVRYINAVWPSRKPRVYRNEDTGWGFPWYFKFNSGNLQAEAQDAVSTVDAPRWYEVKHYGWRMTMFSMYPNAISIKQVPGPDYSSFPWFNTIFLSFLALVGLGIWRTAARLRRRYLEKRS